MSSTVDCSDTRYNKATWISGVGSIDSIVSDTGTRLFLRYQFQISPIGICTWRTSWGFPLCASKCAASLSSSTKYPRPSVKQGSRSFDDTPFRLILKFPSRARKSVYNQLWIETDYNHEILRYTSQTFSPLALFPSLVEGWFQVAGRQDKVERMSVALPLTCYRDAHSRTV